MPKVREMRELCERLSSAEGKARLAQLLACGDAELLMEVKRALVALEFALKEMGAAIDVAAAANDQTVAVFEWARS